MKKKLNWHWIWFQGIVLVAGNSHRMKQYCYVMSTGCTAQGHFSWLSWLLVLEQKAFLLLWQKSKWQKISICKWEKFFTYRISANSFRGNYSFLNLEIVENSNSCRKFQFFYLIGKLNFCCGNYSRTERNYRISSYSFRGNNSFLNLEIAENSNSCRKFQFFT